MAITNYKSLIIQISEPLLRTISTMVKLNLSNIS